ncbi:isoleucyl-tRNA synthetase [Paragonimus westermani]|uniref:isoleucine--tRNA ligase n=1 Tax=Paragonimus westermani TaxID=34504 RepID=A0A5J4NCI7_9TREM|nr:isoleucyl-tRNA synthetase [Paragonimus westermani]
MCHPSFSDQSNERINGHESGQLYWIVFSPGASSSHRHTPMSGCALLPTSVNIPEEEVAILDFWEKNECFKTSLKQSESRPRFTFYDGPPFATGLPHYGHLLAGTIKDIIPRYAHQSGFHVERRFGWDCHGLPVEYEVDKECDIHGPDDVAKMGINAYNDKCRSIVMKYIVVSFPLTSQPDVELIAWTTTPWTLASNLALCVHPDRQYVKIFDKQLGRTFILMEARLPSLYRGENEYTILDSFAGKKLENLSYEPMFDYFAHLKEERGAFRVLCDSYVTEDTGTGVVHQAPYFGEDDYRVCTANGIISKDSSIICPVDATGRFTAEVQDFAGQYVKDADKAICQQLKKRGRMVHQSTVNHSYPYCWRSDTPLIYKAVPTWFIRVENLVEKLLENNAKCHWVPDFVREGRFANWLRDARDWAVSRNRFWGTPMPLWVSEDLQEVICVGSIDELHKLSGVRITDLHREKLIEICFLSGKCCMKLVVSTSLWLHIHYPFENTKAFEEGFPADFIAEGIDQTRGWFYTLLVLSTALFDKPPFKHLIVNGIVLASDGQKMSKRLKNYPDPAEIMQKHGADALRLYLINSPVVRAQNLRFCESGVHEVVKDVFLPWYNALRFLIESSVVPYERATNRKFSVTPESVPRTDNFMDRWILSFTQSLILFVHKELSEYRLYTVVPRLVKFIDHLVNWYVRMNRRRLKGDAVNNSEDWRTALHTLTHVLFQMTCLFSPFTPFLTEFIYQRLRSRLDFTGNLKDHAGLPVGYCRQTGAPDSVHYLPVPKANQELISNEIEEVVSWMQSTVELGRIIRTRVNLPLKAPLHEAIVIHSDPAVRSLIQSAKSYIVEELNVRLLTTTDDKQRYGVQLRGVLNHRILGSRLKQDYKAVVEAVKQMPTAELEKFAATGSITVCGHLLGSDDLSVVYTTGSNTVCEALNGSSSGNQTGNTEKKGGFIKTRKHSAVAHVDPVAHQRYETASDARGLLVLLDTTADPELEDERLARELVNRIQRTRKKAQLVPEDPIVVVVSTDSSALRRIASPTSTLIGLIQATVKQPMAVTPARLDASDDQEWQNFARVCLPAGWYLGHEIIRDTVSIPPDDFELALFSRTNKFEDALSSSLHQPDMSVSSHRGAPNAWVIVINRSIGQQCEVTLSDSDGRLLVLDSDDLLRKVKCVFGWSHSVHLRLYVSESEPLAHISTRHMLSLTGKTLYTASETT